MRIFKMKSLLNESNHKNLVLSAKDIHQLQELVKMLESFVETTDIDSECKQRKHQVRCTGSYVTQQSSISGGTWVTLWIGESDLENWTEQVNETYIL